ncbi:glycoside hydrolase family 130 protein [bacterium]|nr:glycoside hydrolase family 130 protein [bacterium]
MANETVVKRYEGNPIIRPEQIAGVNSIFNSAVVPFEGGYAGVFRCDETDREMTLHAGFSDDGIHWDISPDRINLVCDDPEIATHGVGYDPRVIPMDGTFYVNWCNNYHGPTIGLARTDDFKTFTQMENMLPPYNRNGVLFPRKIGGNYAMLHRPSDRGHTPFGDMFYAESPDLMYWGKQRFVFGTAGGWQSTKIGPGPVPIETDEGWLCFYHGVLNSCNGFVYGFGACILDLDEPWKVLARTRPYLMAPTMDYERVGDVPNVVFPTACIVHDDGTIWIYYGCADTTVGLATCKMDEVIAFTKANSLV